MKIKRIGVDLAKNVYQLHGVDQGEQCVLQQRLKRDNWLKVLFEKTEPGCEIGMEACTGSHHWARLLREKGYIVKLIAPQFVKPYVKSNKNDAKDAEAICEAMSRPSMRFVPIKTVDQQDIQAMHRIRSELICHRTAKGNQIRGLVAEGGFCDYRQIVRHHVMGNPLLTVLAWWVPFLVPKGGDPIDSVEAISPMPVLFVHGKADHIVPWQMSQAMYDRAGEPKELWLIDEMDHYEVWEAQPEAAQARLSAFFEMALNRGDFQVGSRPHQGRMGVGPCPPGSG